MEETFLDRRMKVKTHEIVLTKKQMVAQIEMLKEAVNALTRHLNVELVMIGHPYRRPFVAVAKEGAKEMPEGL